VEKDPEKYRSPDRDNLDYDEDDPRDPYITGRPMGRAAIVVFVLIMFVIPMVIEVLEHFHILHIRH
jgi:hypothetical protein